VRFYVVDADFDAIGDRGNGIAELCFEEKKDAIETVLSGDGGMG
jgi:hypothetical protein